MHSKRRVTIMQRFVRLLFLVFVVAAVADMVPVEMETIEEGMSGNAIFESPLLAAARDGDLDRLREQLRDGADVNYQNEVGWTPLIYSVEMGKMDIFNELVDFGANVNYFEQDGWTALMFAAFHGDDNMVIRILNVGGDPLHMNNAGYASHSIAFNQGHQHTGEMIADAACIAALNNGDYISAFALIREGASVNVYNPQGWTPLIYSVAQQFVGDVEVLLKELGADVNQVEKDGWSPLMFAVNSGNWEMTKLLIEYGANVGHAANNGLTAMDLAADREDNMALVDLLAPALNMSPADEVEQMQQQQEEVQAKEEANNNNNNKKDQEVPPVTTNKANILPTAGGSTIPTAKSGAAASAKKDEKHEDKKKKSGFSFW